MNIVPARNGPKRPTPRRAGTAVGQGRSAARPRPASRPGDALHAALKRLGLGTKAGCRCNSRVRAMNARGTDWCLANVDTIVGWLEEEAQRRRLPFVRALAQRFVLVVLRRQRRSEGAR